MANQIVGSLNRTAKLFIDSGAAATVEEALERLGGLHLHLSIGADEAQNPVHQVTLLTALNCARRTFLGGVSVNGALDVPLLIELAEGPTLAAAVRELGGVIVNDVPATTPLVQVGGEARKGSGSLALRTTFDGWRAGVVPLASAMRLGEAGDFRPAGILAGALAVAEVFAHYNGNAIAGYRPVGLSLWDLSPDADWIDPASDGPPPMELPRDFWLIGLGHLGQAFLWTIASLPYPRRDAVRLFLQDVDDVGASTPSTSVLTTDRDIGHLKTRVCSRWAERRGFDTRIIERRFGADAKVGHGEPALAICGVDNPQARRILDQAGFSMVFEAGLGSSAVDYALLRMHSFPNSHGSRATWPMPTDHEVAIRGGQLSQKHQLPAYADLASRGEIDTCGLTLLADVAVGVPFVGMTAAATVIAQIIRTICGGRRACVFDLDLTAVSHRSVVWRNEPDDIVFALQPTNGHCP